MMSGMYGMKRFEVSLMLDGQPVYVGRVRSKSKQAAIVNVLTNKYKGNFDTTYVEEVIDVTHELIHASKHLGEAAVAIVKAQEMLMKVNLSDGLDEEDKKELLKLTNSVDYATITSLRNMVNELSDKL